MAVKQRVNITLTDEALDMVRQLAEQRGTTVSEVVRQAISHEKWLAAEVASGSRIVAENRRDNERRELVIS